MAYISQVKLPNNTTYDIKDTSAWTQIAALQEAVGAGLTLVVLGSEALPTASANTMGKIYLKTDNSHDPSSGTGWKDVYDEYVTVKTGTSTYTWEKIGNTDVNLSNYSLKTHTHAYSGITDAGSAHKHTIGACTSTYIQSQANVPLTFGSTSFVTGVSTSKLEVTKASKATAGTAVNVATVGTAVVYGKADVSSAVNVGTALGGTTTFNTDAIKSATLGGATTFNTNAIKSASLGGTTTFNTDAIKGVTLGGNTTFALSGVTVTAPSNGSELLTFGTASTGTVNVASTTPASSASVTISTTPADSSTVTISTTAATKKTVTLTTTSITPAKAAPNTQTITPAVANGSITPYTFTDVSVATGTLASNGTGATVAIGSSGSGNGYSSVATTATLLTNTTADTSTGAVKIVTDIPTKTGNESAHTHGYSGTTQAANS